MGRDQRDARGAAGYAGAALGPDHPGGLPTDGRADTPGLGAFQTATSGVEGFCVVLAKEVAPLGIRVTMLKPGDFVAGDPDTTARAIVRLATRGGPGA